MEGPGCLFLVLLQNDDETIWRRGGGEVCRGWGGGLHSSINDFLAVQRDVKDRLT